MTELMTPCLLLSALLFALGFLTVLTRRNTIIVLMGLELILNSANLAFATFSRFAEGGLQGQLVALFVILVAAAEAAVALAIVLKMYQLLHTVSLDEASEMKE